MAEQKDIKALTENLAEYICDTKCKHPYEADQEQLSKLCNACEMNDLLNQIENWYTERAEMIDKLYLEKCQEVNRLQETLKEKKVIYACDGRDCGGECKECKHTTNVEHAINFSKEGDIFVERIQSGESDLISRKVLLENVKHMDFTTVANDGIKYIRKDMVVKLISEQPQEYGWISVNERYPENEQSVEITYVTKHYDTGELIYRTARAFYTDGYLSTEQSCYCWENMDDWDYDERQEAYIIPEGWWEDNDFTEEFGVVYEKVIAWRQLPEPYKE